MRAEAQSVVPDVEPLGKFGWKSTKVLPFSAPRPTLTFSSTLQPCWQEQICQTLVNFEKFVPSAYNLLCCTMQSLILIQIAPIVSIDKSVKSTLQCTVKIEVIKSTRQIKSVKCAFLVDYWRPSGLVFGSTSFSRAYPWSQRLHWGETALAEPVISIQALWNGHWPCCVWWRCCPKCGILPSYWQLPPLPALGPICHQGACTPLNTHIPQYHMSLPHQLEDNDKDKDKDNKYAQHHQHTYHMSLPHQVEDTDKDNKYAQHSI